MRMPTALARHGLEDLNVLLPGFVIAAGLGTIVAGKPPIGVGIAVGAMLALLNSVLLVKRIDLAIASGMAVTAMIAMQLGLFVTFTLVGAITVVMVLISLPMTIAMAISFFGVQTAELILYYRARRSRLDAGPTGLTEHRV